MSRHLVILTAIVLAGCAAKEGEMKTVDYVDIDRFMGAWYVIGNIPTFVEKDIYNAVETYSLNADGTIKTVFTFRRGGFDGKERNTTQRVSCWISRPMLAGECSLSGQ